MYAAKPDGERVAMYDIVVALKDAMVKLEVVLMVARMSMVAQAGGETIKALSNLVISTYVICLDITKTNTPYLKVCYCPQESYRLFNLYMAL
jgi:hypothetical protein